MKQVYFIVCPKATKLHEQIKSICATYQIHPILVFVGLQDWRGSTLKVLTMEWGNYAKMSSSSVLQIESTAQKLLQKIAKTKKPIVVSYSYEGLNAIGITPIVARFWASNFVAFHASLEWVKKINMMFDENATFNRSLRLNATTLPGGFESLEEIIERISVL